MTVLQDGQHFAAIRRDWTVIPAAPWGASNYIFVIETGGLRIAHFGDIGQDALTAEQLAILGEIVFAITQLANSYSNMNAGNQKGLNLMKQVKPHLILPTHFDTGAVQPLIQEWPGGYFVVQGPAILSREKTPDGTGLFYMGSGAGAFPTALRRPPELQKQNRGAIMSTSTHTRSQTWPR